MVNDKRTRFQRIAVDRTNRILENFRLLGNCSNKNNYEYSEDDIKKIFKSIETELKKTKLKFEQKNGTKKFNL